MIREFRSATCLLLLWVTACTSAAPPRARAVQEPPTQAQLPKLDLVDRSTPCPTAPVAPLRLLTPREYANTLRALLPGIDLPPSAELTNARTSDQPLGLSSLVLERQFATAVELGKRVAADLPAQARCQPGNDVECVRRFVASFAMRAFRRPLSEPEQVRITQFFEERAIAGRDRALADALTAILLSPQFLYRMDLVRPGASKADAAVPKSYAVATRLSYFLWQSMPDQALFDAAARGELVQPGKVTDQINRMLGDSKAASAFESFVSHWFELDKVLLESKSPRLFAHWLPNSAQSSVDESKAFVRWVYASAEPTLSSLLLSRHAEVDDAMAAIYGIAPNGKPQGVELDSAERSGLLTRTAFLAGHAHGVPSPPLRGAFVLRNLLCQSLPPPPANVANFVPSTNSAQGPSTNRQRFERAITGGRMCIACHTNMDPLGYAFENYDATGRYVGEEQGLAIDAKVNLTKLGLQPVDGAVELSKSLASSPEVAYCASALLYARAEQRDISAHDWCRIDPAYAAFARSGGNFKVLLATIASSQEFLFGDHAASAR